MAYPSLPLPGARKVRTLRHINLQIYYHPRCIVNWTYATWKYLGLSMVEIALAWVLRSQTLALLSTEGVLYRG